MLLHVHSVQPRLAVGAVALQGSLLGGHAQWLGLVLQPRHDALQQLQVFLKAPAVEGSLTASMPRAALFPKTPGEPLGPACSRAPPLASAAARDQWPRQSRACSGVRGLRDERQECAPTVMACRRAGDAGHQHEAAAPSRCVFVHGALRQHRQRGRCQALCSRYGTCLILRQVFVVWTVTYGPKVPLPENLSSPYP